MIDICIDYSGVVAKGGKVGCWTADCLCTIDVYEKNKKIKKDDQFKKTLLR